MPDRDVAAPRGGDCGYEWSASPTSARKTCDATGDTDAEDSRAHFSPFSLRPYNYHATNDINCAKPCYRTTGSYPEGTFALAGTYEIASPCDITSAATSTQPKHKCNIVTQHQLVIRH